MIAQPNGRASGIFGLPPDSAPSSDGSRPRSSTHGFTPRAVSSASAEVALAPMTSRNRPLSVAKAAERAAGRTQKKLAAHGEWVDGVLYRLVRADLDRESS
jgi:hypothetical protein